VWLISYAAVARQTKVRALGNTSIKRTTAVHAIWSNRVPWEKNNEYRSPFSAAAREELTDIASQLAVMALTITTV